MINTHGAPYAEYKNHSNCGRQIDFETEYAKYECGRSETNSEKMNKKKKVVLPMFNFFLGFDSIRLIICHHGP